MSENNFRKKQLSTDNLQIVRRRFSHAEGQKCEVPLLPRSRLQGLVVVSSAKLTSLWLKKRTVSHQACSDARGQ